MKKILDWRSDEIVNIFDEASLWSAPFGRLLLEELPMKRGMQVLDIGFGTGFPLIELGQRFGNSSRIYGIDIWEAGVRRAREKAKQLALDQIEFLEQSATSIPLADEQIDLVTSNLGVNNFEDKEQVYLEIQRVLKPGGKLCITTNPIGTFTELFDLFLDLLQELDQPATIQKVETYIAHRQTKALIEAELTNFGFQLTKSRADATDMRFVDGEAVLDHSLIRIGFRESWQQMIPVAIQQQFFERLKQKIDDLVLRQGAFKMSIPMLYLEFEKQ